MPAELLEIERWSFFVLGTLVPKSECLDHSLTCWANDLIILFLSFLICETSIFLTLTYVNPDTHLASNQHSIKAKVDGSHF